MHLFSGRLVWAAIGAECHRGLTQTTKELTSPVLRPRLAAYEKTGIPPHKPFVMEGANPVLALSRLGRSKQGVESS